MSERSIEEMMEMLQESEEARYDFGRKSEKVIENLRQKRADDFLRVAAAIKVAPEYAKRRKFIGKYKIDKESLFQEFFELAHGSLDSAEINYINEMILYLEKSSDIFSEYFNVGSELQLKPLFQAVLDKEITLPSLSEFTAFKSKNWLSWDWCVIPGQLANATIMFALDRKLDSIHAKLENNSDIDWVDIVNDDRPNQYYMIAVDKVMNSISRNLFKAGISPDIYRENLHEKDDEFRGGVDDFGRAKLRGLTQAEYGVLLIEEIKTQITKYDKLPQDVNLYDSASTGRAVLLGTKQIVDKKINGYATAWWDDSKRILHFGNDRDDRNDLFYSPRLSVGFDGFNKEPNE